MSVYKVKKVKVKDNRTMRVMYCCSDFNEAVEFKRQYSSEEKDPECYFAVFEYDEYGDFIKRYM